MSEIDKAARRVQRERLLIETAFQGLFEYYECLSDSTFAAEIASTLVVPDTGNDQQDYEKVRDQIEAVIARRG